MYIYGRQGRHAEIIEQLSVVCFPCWPLHSFQWLSSDHPLSYPYTHTCTCTHRDMYIYVQGSLFNACMYSCPVFSKFLLSDNLLTISKNFLRLLYILLISYPSIHSWQQWKIKFEFLVHAFYLSFFKNCMFYFILLFFLQYKIF